MSRFSRNPYLQRIIRTPGGSYAFMPGQSPNPYIQQYSQPPQPPHPDAPMGPPVQDINAVSADLTTRSGFLKNLMRLRAKDPNASDDDIYNQLAPNVLKSPHTHAYDHGAAVSYLRNLVGTGPQGNQLPIPSQPPKPEPQPNPVVQRIQQQYQQGQMGGTAMQQQNAAIRAKYPMLFGPISGAPAQAAPPPDQSQSEQ